MRNWILAAAGAVALGAAVPSPASADCWPQCVFQKSGSAEQAGSRRSSKRASKPEGSGFSFADERPQRRSGGSTAYRGSSSGGSGGGSSGIASYYWQPQRVASGGWFNPNAMTAAHKTLPFGTRVRVTHMGNGRSVEVTINDRGPYVAGRVIDLSKAAAGVIGMQGQGIANVRMEVLGR